MNFIRKFLYRFPRFTTECPMDLIFGDTVVIGTCLNISESGLRGIFSGEVPAGTKGLLTLYQGDRSFKVHAVLLSFHGEQARVRFRFQSKEELVAVHEFLTVLTHR